LQREQQQLLSGMRLTQLGGVYINILINYIIFA